MHTDVSLELLSQVTISFGTRIRAFQEKTCAAFSTHELEHERAARLRWQDKVKKAAAGINSNAQKGKKATAETKSNAQKGTKVTTKTKSQPQKSSSGRQLKQFNLNTYKFHALGDYCNTIRLRHNGFLFYSTSRFILTSHLSCLLHNSFRVNVNIEFQKGATCVLVVGQYRSSCQRSNNDSVVSA